MSNSLGWLKSVEKIVNQGGLSADLQPHTPTAWLCKVSLTLVGSSLLHLGPVLFFFFFGRRLTAAHLRCFGIVPLSKLVFTVRRITGMRMSRQSIMISARMGSTQADVNFDLEMTFLSCSSVTGVKWDKTCLRVLDAQTADIVRHPATLHKKTKWGFLLFDRHASVCYCDQWPKVTLNT